MNTIIKRNMQEFIAYPLSAEEVAERLKDKLQQSGVNLYSIVNHQEDMKQKGITIFPAYTFIFGNPVIGSQLIRLYPQATVDIPLRLAVIETNEGSNVIMRRMETLFTQEQLKNQELVAWCNKVNEILRKSIKL